jgi:hypothetical protein
VISVFCFLFSAVGKRLRVAAFCLLALVFESSAQTNITPAAFLASQPKPHFAPGHHLPLLSAWSWPFPCDLRVEMAANWGYALAIDGPLDGGGLQKQLANPKSVTARCVALAAQFPDKFKLQVNLDRDFPTDLSDGFYVTNSRGWFVDDHTNTWQYATNKQYHRIVSPEGPDSDWIAAAEYWVAPLRTLQSNAPIAIILNGGEYGLGVTGFDRRAWQFDPRVTAALATNGLSWNRYISNRKAHQLGIVAQAVRSAVPRRQLYIFYNTGNEQNRFTRPGYGNWEDGWANWGWASDVLNAVTDLPSFENYYRNQSSWTNAAGAKWNQLTDLLTRQLNAVGYNQAIGATNLSYGWVCGGWSLKDTNRLADIPRYMGFLKCLYTSGMIGAVAGYFEYPTGTNASIFGEHGFASSFPATTPPHWLLQIIALAHVHALFSQTENFLYHGDLLPGPGRHYLSEDQPACEFPTGDPAVHVLVRKLRIRDEWLITAWAADGPDREASVTIPVLGQVKTLARASGAVYEATGVPGHCKLALMDADGILPTEHLPHSSN